MSFDINAMVQARFAALADPDREMKAEVTRVFIDEIANNSKVPLAKAASDIAMLKVSLYESKHSDKLTEIQSTLDKIAASCIPK